MASGKGLSKKHSPLQKAHFQQYKLEHRARKNQLIRLKRHITANQNMIAKRHSYNARKRGKGRGATTGRVRELPSIHIDKQAINRLKALSS